MPFAAIQALPWVRNSPPNPLTKSRHRHYQIRSFSPGADGPTLDLRLRDLRWFLTDYNDWDPGAVDRLLRDLHQSERRNPSVHFPYFASKRRTASGRIAFSQVYRDFLARTAAEAIDPAWHDFGMPSSDQQFLLFHEARAGFRSRKRPWAVGWVDERFLLCNVRWFPSEELACEYLLDQLRELKEWRQRHML